MKKLSGLCLCLSLLSLTACGALPERDFFHKRDSAPLHPVDVSNIPNAVPRDEPLSKSGNPPSYVVHSKRYYTLDSSDGYVQRGIASWYGTKFHGKRTSSGEHYDMYAMSAAHKTLPLPTYAEVINLQNGRSTIVKINDRGPFKDNRLIDLSYAAATKLGILEAGTGLVEVRAINTNTYANPTPALASTKPRLTNMYLQVGAFSSRYNAELLKKRLSNISPTSVEVSSDKRIDSLIYRVRLGPIASVEEADQLATTISTLGIDMPYVVID